MTKLQRTLEIAFTPKFVMVPVLVIAGAWSLIHLLFIEPQNVIVAFLTTVTVLMFMLGLKLLASMSFDILVVGEKENLPRGTMLFLALALAMVGTVLSVPYLIINAPQ